MEQVHKNALASIDANGSLSAALEALKEKILRSSFITEPHEAKKREDYYLQYRLIGSLKEVIKAAINEVEDSNRNG